jgi:hypothetical protein
MAAACSNPSLAFELNEGTYNRAFHVSLAITPREVAHDNRLTLLTRRSISSLYLLHTFTETSTPLTSSFCTITLTMSPALEQQQATSPGGCDTAGKGVFSNIVDETAAYLQKDDGQDLAAQIAGLVLDDHEAKSVLSHDSTTEEEPAPKGMDENSNPKLAASTAAPVSVIPHTEGTIHLHQKAAEDADRFSDEESAGCELEQDNKSDNPTLPTPVNLPNGGSFTIDMSAVAKNTSSEPKQADESDTPRLKTYMKLHNDVRLPLHLPPSLHPTH